MPKVDNSGLATVHYQDRAARRAKNQQLHPYDSGASPDKKASQSPQPASPSVVPSEGNGPAGGFEMKREGAGFFLGMIAWALADAYLKYGPAGPKSWLSAKFLNRPTLHGGQVSVS